jgi:hypothetical protein
MYIKAWKEKQKDTLTNRLKADLIWNTEGRIFGCLLFWPTVPAAGYFFSGKKVTKKPLEPTDSRPPSFIPVLACRRHPWQSAWQLSVGFRCRPQFFILYATT